MASWKLTCDKCGKEVRNEDSCWHEVTGWDRKRVQGGTNHIALRKLTGKVMCFECMTMLQAGLSVGQMAL